MPQPDLMKMLGQKQVDVTDLAYQFGFFAQNNKWGPMIATGDEIAPGTAIATFAVRKDYLQKNRDTVIRWTMAYLQGVKEFNAAAKAPAKHAEIVDILASTTALNKPELIRAIAPHWSYVNEDGAPPVDSIMTMQDFWNGKDFHFVENKVAREQLFDLSVAKEAKARLDREKPFGRERAGSSHASDRLVGPVPPMSACRAQVNSMTNELWRWQACDLAQAIRKRQISCREAVTSCLARLEQVNPRINAVVDVLAREALVAADAPMRQSRRGPWARCMAFRSRSRSMPIMPGVPRPTAWWRSRTASPKRIVQPSRTGAKRAQSS